MSRTQVVVAGKFLWATKELEEFGKTVDVLKPDCSSREAFLKGISGKEPVAILAVTQQSIGKYDRDFLKSLPRSVKYIAWHGAGYDPVDVEAATELGINVSHTPGAVDHGTATTALFLMLSALRQYSHAEANARSDSWLKDFPLAHDPEGKTIGIVGMGGIGSALARRCLPFDMNILYHNRKPASPKPDFPCEYVASLDDLLARSDVVSLHMPLNDSTKNAFGKEQFAKMKDGAVLVNTARGGVVDQEALIEALASGKLYSAGLDVFPNEPEIDERLRRNPKITILPHVGTHTMESRYGMEMLVLNNIRQAVEKGTLITQVAEQRNKA